MVHGQLLAVTYNMAISYLPWTRQMIWSFSVYFKGTILLIFLLGVTQATQGAGFSGLRYAPVPMKNRH